MLQYVSMLILIGQKENAMVNTCKFYVILALEYYLLYSNIYELFLFQENKFCLKLRRWVFHPHWIILHYLVVGQIRTSICTAAISEVIWWNKGRYSAYSMARTTVGISLSQAPYLLENLCFFFSAPPLILWQIHGGRDDVASLKLLSWVEKIFKLITYHLSHEFPASHCIH